MRYYVVIPAHNEAQFIEGTLNSLLEQRLKPSRVVVVNDNSSDGTEQIINTFSAKHDQLQGLTIATGAAHMPGSKVVHAFAQGLALLDDQYDFIVKLDADVLLPDDYFERIANAFRNNPKIGVAGGFIYEQDQQGEWRLNHPMDKKHVRGAIKAYSKACFKAIGGLKNAMGWDTVDELLAQYHGFELHTDPKLHVKHLRPTGSGYNPRARGLQGQAMYRMRYGLGLTLIASLKMALKQGRWKTFTENLSGFMAARRKQLPFLIGAPEGDFVRSLRWQNIKRKLLT
ncbi:glycosyltransferase family 2 protein [Maribacter sp. 2307ULW6-5]|uniref:glycosyltransferase family 2 protein n=1 Tax=Maribacter sp. 2307ULW6-5 TaxID=3386275 RepID=UPI0039BC68F6